MSQVESVERAFALVPDPAAYVPRAATEAALAAVAAALDGGAAAVVLRGPEGIGKSLVLRLLGTRLGPGYDVLHTVTGALPLADLLGVALGSRGSAGSGRDRLRRAVAGALREAGRGPVLVLPVDDAGALSLAAARGLAGLARRAEHSLRLVFAEDTGAAENLVAAFGRSLAEVRLDAPLSDSEVASYLDARMARSPLPEALRSRFAGPALARLHALSGGNPARLNRLAIELAEAPEPPPLPLAEATERVPPPPPARLPRDPFGPAAAAACYQPRSASEALLGRIERELLRGRRAVVLRGPAGIGKTTLLRVLEERLHEPFQPVAVPYARLEPVEFWGFVLHQLGAPRGDAPERELHEIALRLARVGGVLVLLVDEATVLPEATARSLLLRLEEAAGAVRVVLTADDESPERGLPRFADPAEIRIDERLAPAETESYLLGRLLHFGAPAAVRRRFDARTIAALHRASAGLPRDLNRLAGEIERQALPPVLFAPLAVAGGPARPAATVVESGPRAAFAAPRVSRVPERGWQRRAVSILPHLGLGLGIPLALFALWLWLAPLFAR